MLQSANGFTQRVMGALSHYRPGRPSLLGLGPSCNHRGRGEVGVERKGGEEAATPGRPPAWASRVTWGLRKVWKGVRMNVSKHTSPHTHTSL